MMMHGLAKCKFKAIIFSTQLSPNIVSDGSTECSL